MSNRLYTVIGRSTRPEGVMKTKVVPSPHFRGAPVDLVVDVRSKLEFWTGHLPGAVCIPVETLPQGITGRAAPQSRILVYCAGGARSAVAAAQLREAGYEHVVDGGGLAAAREEFTP